MVVEPKGTKKGRHFYNSIVEKLLLQKKDTEKGIPKVFPLNPVIQY